jgi:hypothetical protein
MVKCFPSNPNWLFKFEMIESGGQIPVNDNECVNFLEHLESLFAPNQIKNTSYAGTY